MQLSQDEARSLFAAGGFLLFDKLPAGSDFGVDCGPVYAVTERFQGLKFVPPGLHLFTFAPEASTSALGGIRQGFLRFHEPRQIVSRTYSPSSDAIERPATSTVLAQPPAADPVAISSGHLQTLDPHLAPYPLETWARWKTLTRWVDTDLIGILVGFDEQGDAHIDAMAEPPTLRLPEINLTRSAPPGARGALLTRYTIDKSFLVARLACDFLRVRAGHGLISLVGALQLAFVLFVGVQNAAAMDFYRKLLVALSHSSDLAAGRPPPSMSPVEDLGREDLFVNLVDMLDAQLGHLRPEFFSEDAPAEEEWWLKALQDLARLLEAAASEGVAETVTQARRKALSRLAETVEARFGWSIGDAKEIGPNGAEDLEAEDEEDRPVIVEP